jgi:hypothetical protein
MGKKVKISPIASHTNTLDVQSTFRGAIQFGPFSIYFYVYW